MSFHFNVISEIHLSKSRVSINNLKMLEKISSTESLKNGKFTRSRILKLSLQDTSHYSLMRFSFLALNEISVDSYHNQLQVFHIKKSLVYGTLMYFYFYERK